MLRNPLPLKIMIVQLLIAVTWPVFAENALELDRIQQEQLGREAYQQGKYVKAAAFYRNALNLSQIGDDSERIASNAYHLALCEMAMGRDDDALQRLKDAAYELKHIGKDDSDVLLLSARLYRKQGFRDRAAGLAQKVAKRKSSQTTPVILMQAHLFLADMACESNREKDAERELREAQKRVGEDTPQILKARLYEVQARLALLQQDYLKAGKMADAMVRALKAAERYPDIAPGLSFAGEAYEKAGEWNRAADRYYRSARSFSASGNPDGCGQMIQRTSAFQDKIDPELRDKIAVLAEQLDG